MKKYWITKADAERIIGDLYSFDPLVKRLKRQMGIKPVREPKPSKEDRNSQRYVRSLFKKWGLTK